MSNEFRINSHTFKKRIKELYSLWQSSAENEDGNSFPKLDALIFAVGTSEDVIYSKFSSLQIWLFGYELTDMIMTFCENEIVFLASIKKATFLKQVQDIKDPLIPKITVLTRDKADADKHNFQTIMEALRRSKNGTSLGTFTKNNFSGDFIKHWEGAIEGQDFEFTDISTEMARLYAVKDDHEIATLTKCCKLTSDLYTKYFKDKIMEIVDQDKHVKHAKLADGIEEAVTNPKYVSSQDSAYLDVCYSPIIQSGTGHVLKFSIISDKNDLSFDVITCFLGLRYKSYCANVIRTILVNPTPDIEENYEFLLEVEEKLMSLMVAGKKLSDIYNEVALFVQSKRPELVDKLTKNLGFVTGIEFRESCFVLGQKCHEILKPGMTFNLNFGFTGIPRKDDPSKPYGLFLGDIVVVNGQDQPPTVLTNVKKKFKHAAIIFKEEDEDENESGEEESEEEDLSDGDRKKSEKKSGKSRKEKEPSPILTSSTGRALRKTVLENKLRNEATMEDKRREKQSDLFANMQEEAQRRLTQKKDEKSLDKIKKSNVSYKSRSQMPENEPDIIDLKIFVDKKTETVILPIFGMAVPFHISTIKNISQSIEGSFTYLRINFFHPTSLTALTGGPQDPNNINTANNNNDDQNGHSGLNDSHNSASGTSPDASFNFLKEITYRASNLKTPHLTTAPSANLNNAFRIIKEVQKRFRTKEAEEKEMQDLVLQDKLILNNPANSGGNFYANSNIHQPGSSSSIIRLKDLYIRPNIAQKRITGTLEAHVNGFRYTSIRGDKVDILYNNIKHAFYQPCDHEMIILLHFNLKHGIILGKKKHSDIQFYTEVGEITTDLGKRQYMMHDRDDLQSEQAERELRHKLNTAFKTFCDRVEASPHNRSAVSSKSADSKSGSHPLIEFEAPFRELGFHGVPYRSTVLLQPTSSCLVNLIEWPPFVITLDEVELVHFERVQFHLKNYDMVFVFKDYFKKTVMINAIPMTSLDPVKEWLNSCDIYYTEGIQSLNWTKIMKTITDDPEGFFASGGWKFLKIESDSDEEVEVEDEDEGGGDENGGTAVNGSAAPAKKAKRKRERSFDSDEESDYQPSESELEESSSSEGENSDDSDASEDASGSGSGSEASSNEESGKDWDELEAEAAKADRERDANMSYDDRHKHSSGQGKKKGSSMHNSKRPAPSHHKSSDYHNKKFKH